MSFADPGGWWALALTLPIIALHILAPRRQERIVSSTMLWAGVNRPVTASSPWQRLRITRLLLLQLLTVVVFAATLAHPVRLTSATLARHTVFVIDVSASMGARDGDPDRLGTARKLAARLRRELPAGGVASVVEAGPQPRVLLSASPERNAFASVLARLRVIDGSPDWPTAFSLAAGLTAPDAPVGYVLLSDGRLSPADQKAIPPGTVWKKVGSRATNRAITRLSVEPRKGGLTARVTIRNPGGARARQGFRIDVDGQTVARAEVVLPSGATTSRSLPVPSGDLVEAFLTGSQDLLGADDRAVAVASGRRSLRILVAGPPDPFLDALLTSLPGGRVDRRADPVPASGYDLAVYDQVAVPIRPDAPFLAIDPPAGVPGLTASDRLPVDGDRRDQGAVALLGGLVDQPAITLVRTDSPILAGLDLSGVAIASAQLVRLPETLPVGVAADVLIGSEETPLLIQGRVGGRAFAWLTFALQDSTLPLDVAYPLLGDRLVRSLARADTAPPDVLVGQSLPLPQNDRQVRVVNPAGTSELVPPGSAAPTADRPGFWKVQEPGRPDRVIAVNVDPAESTLAPADALPIALPRGGLKGRLQGERPLLRWALLLLALVLALEWFEGRRTRGVPELQWNVARIARAVTAVALVVTALGLTLPRRGGATTVLFLIDGSDSVGPAGIDAAAAWVRDALGHQPSGAQAGVAVVGADARLEVRPMKRAHLGALKATIIRSRTNLSTGLRLADAVLPSIGRRRIVLLSDGRATDGDALDEARRLGAHGTAVDVVAISPLGGPDAAITDLMTPASVRVGEEVTVRALIRTTQPGPASVELSADGQVVVTRRVDLRAGDTVVDFPAQRPSKGAIVRYRAQVRRSGDLRPQNDSAYSATAVDGPPTVLIVEGATGDGLSVASALRSQQIAVDTVQPGGLPALDQLVGYAATILINVDAGTLSSDQVRALSAATRELGHGLVVIGGEHAYGLGGYRNSELETLLPVESDILDLKRHLSVAEVLAIDTSASMGMCHCAPSDAAVFRVPGGVNKTDISRSGAAQAIDALNPSDQVGVLTFDVGQRWAIPLSRKPASATVRKQLGALVSSGGTDLTKPLLIAGARLKQANAKLKHIVLFTDGFAEATVFPELEAQAAQLVAEGITVSVVATGEGAADQLKGVASAGHGRFYPGTDLLAVPQILASETVIASRAFINEGRFVPLVAGAGAPVRTLTSSPPLLGYVATTARPQAQTWLRIGPERDPLLASWRIGLGRVTAWTSDAAARWSQEWAHWDGYGAFWASVVKDTFPPAGGQGASLRVERRTGGLRVTLEGAQPFDDSDRAEVRVAGPGGDIRTIGLDRVAAVEFVGEIATDTPGSYALGATVLDAKGRSVASASRLTSAAYSQEYAPAPVDTAALYRLAAASGGRKAITPASAFASAGLKAGHRKFALGGPLLVLAALLFPIDAALRRLSRRGRPVVRADRTKQWLGVDRGSVTVGAGYAAARVGRRARRAGAR